MSHKACGDQGKRCSRQECAQAGGGHYERFRNRGLLSYGLGFRMSEQPEFFFFFISLSKCVSKSTFDLETAAQGRTASSDVLDCREVGPLCLDLQPRTVKVISGGLPWCNGGLSSLRLKGSRRKWLPFLKMYFYFLCMGACSACMCICAPCTCSAHRIQKPPVYAGN